MDLWAPVLRVCVSDKPGVGRVEIDEPSQIVRVGDLVTPQAALDFSLRGPLFTEKALALLTLIALEWDKQGSAFAFARGAMAQRSRFAVQLGMAPQGFSRFVARTLRPQSGRILCWHQMHPREGRERSRTGGPWWLAVRRVTVEPSVATARAFLETVRNKSIDKGRDPQDLLRDALAVRERGDWVEALGLLESLAARFRSRKWARNDPFWFEILLVLAGTQMQLGARGLWPRVPTNVRVSISEQGLHGPEYALIAARAHYIAALMYNQSEDGKSARQSVRELRRCKELMAGRRDLDALEEFWKAASHEEIRRARRTGVAAPRLSSAILEAGRVVETQGEQNLMRYGETLLYADRPTPGLDYIQTALQSGRMKLPAQIIGRRLEAMAKWMLGERKHKTLDDLTQLHKEAREIGFAHQARSILAATSSVRQGVRSLPPE